MGLQEVVGVKTEKMYIFNKINLWRNMELDIIAKQVIMNNMYLGFIFPDTLVGNSRMTPSFFSWKYDGKHI